ncbi:TPA: exo-alpha-sialidase [Candidatus Poribacteria bacterium]|nr:exo-alpha-sialidase [Candidatus Poribacteria bacterium]
MSISVWESVAEPTSRYPECHCSAILELSNGDLIVGYYAGEGEARPNAAWVLAKRRRDAGGFDQLVSVADTPGKPEGNGVLFQVNDGTILLIYGTMHGKLEGTHGPGVRWVTCDLRLKRSYDSGETWSGVEIIEENWGHVPRCKPIRLDNGEILFGTEFTSWHSQIWKSTDEGKTWSVCGNIPGEQNQHPSLIQRNDGSILALIRPSGKNPNVLKSVSHDCGRTWSETEVTQNHCPYAALDAVKLEDGRIAMIWNDNPEKRNPLTIGLSEDGGETWKYKRDIISGEGSFHYPAIIQSRDRLIHATFTNNRATIDHVVLTPDWIEGEGNALPNWEGIGMKRYLI